ncbi:MAG: hypothetical protein RMJ35_12910 [Phycisphaerales bacterium]|nr:hypothetical protein [Phycisphaerales bacterium]
MSDENSLDLTGSVKLAEKNVARYVRGSLRPINPPTPKKAKNLQGQNVGHFTDFRPKS